MRKILISILFCVLLLATGGTALAQGGGAGWFDFITDVRFLGQVWVLNDLTISDDMTVDAITAADLTATDDITATDDLVVGDDLTVADDLTTADLYLTQQSSQTITYAGTITPTGAYHQITADAARGTSSIAIGTSGRVVVLVNAGSNTITLTDTGTLKLSGNAVLGQTDNITLLSDGTNWIQLAKTDN